MTAQRSRQLSPQIRTLSFPIFLNAEMVPEVSEEEPLFTDMKWNGAGRLNASAIPDTFGDSNVPETRVGG